MSALTDQTSVSQTREKRSFAATLEEIWEQRIIFASRWLLAPAYGVLILVLAGLAYKTIKEFIELIPLWHDANEAKAIAQVLVIVDIILVMNLVLMVLFVGYANFVSKMDFAKYKKSDDKPDWFSDLDYTGLKMQLLGSVIAISSILLLRLFVDLVDTNNPNHPSTVNIIILIGTHCTFVVSALILSIINKLNALSKKSRATSS